MSARELGVLTRLGFEELAGASQGIGSIHLGAAVIAAITGLSAGLAVIPETGRSPTFLRRRSHP